ncbi:MAG: peptidoglycan recognition family protein [Candidatus Eremiobacterota bacterium]
MRRVIAIAMLCLWPLLTAETYTDEDIQRMKSKYEGKRTTIGKGLPAHYYQKSYEDPRLVDWMLPYQDWEQEYRAYFHRHYRDARLTFRPSAIVMHYTVTADATSVRDFFIRGAQMSAGDQGTRFGHPSVHLMVGHGGTVYQLLPLDRRCTGAYGVNHVALSIEMVASDEGDLLSRPKQIWSSFCLVRYLMREFDIPLSKVYGHYEVSIGKSVVPEYTDYADSQYPDRYPAVSARSDPGRTYMKWLRDYLGRVGPAPR